MLRTTALALIAFWLGSGSAFAAGPCATGTADILKIVDWEIEAEPDGRSRVTVVYRNDGPSELTLFEAIFGFRTRDGRVLSATLPDTDALPSGSVAIYEAIYDGQVFGALAGRAKDTVTGFVCVTSTTGPDGTKTRP